jgi:hypothetical protein
MEEMKFLIHSDETVPSHPHFRFCAKEWELWIGSGSSFLTLDFTAGKLPGGTSEREEGRKERKDIVFECLRAGTP